MNNSDKLRQIQFDSNIPEGKIEKMILDFKTRWNSMFYMIERLLESLTVVSQILVNESSCPVMPFGSEVSDLRKL